MSTQNVNLKSASWNNESPIVHNITTTWLFTRRTIYNNVCLFITKDSCGAAHQAQVTLPCGLDEDLYVEEGAARTLSVHSLFMTRQWLVGGYERGSNITS